MYIECNPIYYFKIEKSCNSNLILLYVQTLYILMITLKIFRINNMYSLKRIINCKICYLQY